MSRFVQAILIVAVLVSIAFVTATFLDESPEKHTSIVAWDLSGFSPVSVRTRDATLILRSECQELSIVTTVPQAEAVKNALQKIIEKRPLSHDIMADTLEFFEVRIVMARIVELDGDDYRATLIMKQDDKVLEIDSQPSDAIAVALRAGAPVYVSDELLEEQGNDICQES